MKNKLFILLSYLVISIATTSAQNLNTLKLDSLFDRLSDNNKAMGSIAISRNGRVIYRKTIGYRQLSDKLNLPSDLNTKYRIGSITKMFTSTMIFQLIEEGKISLTTTLDNYYPEIPNAKLITIGNMLNHRSGIHNFTDDPDYIKWKSTPKTPSEILTLMAKNKPDFMPNEDAQYSNSNFVLLGFILEKITKQTYSDNLKTRITNKLNLTNTYVGGRINPAKNESFSYEFISSWKQEAETDMSIPCGAGNIVSTPADLTMIIDALFNLKLVKKSSLLQMKTITDNMGMGLFQYPFYNKKAFGHTGGIDGFGSMLCYIPEDSLSVAYTGNGQNYSINEIVLGALSICFNLEYSLPEFKVNTQKTEELDKYLGIYSSNDLPLKITVSKDNTTLVAQATGQASFPLENTGKDTYKFTPAGIVMVFNPDKNEMILAQGGGNYLFRKDK